MNCEANKQAVVVKGCILRPGQVVTTLRLTEFDEPHPYSDDIGPVWLTDTDFVLEMRMGPISVIRPTRYAPDCCMRKLDGLKDKDEDDVFSTEPTKFDTPAEKSVEV